MVAPHPVSVCGVNFAISIEIFVADTSHTRFAHLYIVFTKIFINFLLGAEDSVCFIGHPRTIRLSDNSLADTVSATPSVFDFLRQVINIGWLKDKRYELIEDEIKKLKSICKDKVLKVIIETCFLTDDEKIRMCDIVTSAGADYIKTSTGFGTAGATFDDIKLFSEHIGEGVKMKAAGGISSLDDAERFLELGADRLGTSRVVKLIKAMD